MGQSTSRIIASTGVIISRPCTITCVSVAFVAAASKLEIFDNDDGSGSPIYKVDGTQNVCHAPLQIRMGKLYGKVTGSAAYNITFD